jgi:hypothetical protein
VTLQSVAAENNLAETAYYIRKNGGSPMALDGAS